MHACATRRAVAASLTLITLLGSAREGVSQKLPAAPPNDSSAMEMEVPHGFFTHEVNRTSLKEHVSCAQSV